MKFQIMYALICALSLSNAQQITMGKSEYEVAIFLYDGVELLDFGGPGEVFGATEGFHTYTVSVDGKPLTAQGFVQIVPEYSINNAPDPDIVVYPGGGALATSQDPDVLQWIHKQVARGALQMSVCTGARILAAAGLLDGLQVTTWHGFTEKLQEMVPNAQVLENTRFVDNGAVLTTAGVSAGIDGALRVVERLKGKDVALATALYMEYDKWDPQDGFLAYRNPLIQKIQEQGVINALSGPDLPAFYEGEMKDLAIQFAMDQKYPEAEAILQLVTKAYPYSVTTFAALSQVFASQDKYSPLTEEALFELLKAGKWDEAIDAYHQARKIYPSWVMFREGYMNWAGYRLLQKEQFQDAIRLFTLNAEAYPGSPNVWDSLAEAYLKSGDKTNALVNYRKALQLDPDMESAAKAVETINKGL